MPQAVDEILEAMQRHAEHSEVHMQAVKALCQTWTLDNPAYVASLKQRFAEGTLPGEVEALVLRLALGLGG